jgi:hypothetical protein
MKFDLYLELGTRAQDLQVLELLRFPSDSILVGGVKWSATWWSHGETRRMTSSEREEFLSIVARAGINELEVNLELSNAQHAGMRIISGSLSLYPSVTSDIWADVPTDHLKNREEERKRRSFGAGKSFIGEYQEKYRLPYPTVAEYSLTFETTQHVQSDVEIQTLCVEFIKRAMSEGLRAMPIFGYGCVHGKCRTQMMLHNLGGVPSWVDQLGERFENVYPILVGPLATCEGMVGSLQGGASLFRIPGRVPNGIVSIPPSDIDNARKNAAVKEWVVIRDLMKLDTPAATLDAIYERKKSLPWESPFVKR